jgi:hypothetical protein
VLNPYRAVTEVPAAAGAAVRPPRTPGLGTGRGRVAAADERFEALVISGVAAGTAALVLLLATVLTHGSRRRWRPAPARPAAPDRRTGQA